MAENNELTPEEKLLAVIQKGEARAVAGSTSSGGKTLGDGIDGQAVPRSGSSWVAPLRIRTVDQLLALAVVVLLGLSVYEAYLNLPKAGKRYSVAEMDLKAPREVVLASLSDTLDMFAKRRIFGLPPKAWTPPAQGGDVDLLKGWRAYARDNLRFMGTSNVDRPSDSGEMVDVREAIVMDTKEKKMHFLSVGHMIVLNKQDVRVERIEETSVDLMAGEETLTIPGSTSQEDAIR